MKESSLNVIVHPDDEHTVEMVVRHGEALPLKEPKVINIEGSITTPLAWLRKKTPNVADCHVKVNRDKKQIVLVEDEKSAYSSMILGKMMLTKIFEDFGINTGKFFTTKHLASFFKMNRSYFTSKTEAMDLVNKLSSFHAKIDGAIENVSKSGEKKALIEKVVKSNLPESFALMLPIFRGMGKVLFTVEIFIDVDNYSIQLNSPDAADIMADTVDGMINDVVNHIENEFPDLVICEE